jgi:hypothetical protein
MRQDGIRRDVCASEFFDSQSPYVEESHDSLKSDYEEAGGNKHPKRFEITILLASSEEKGRPRRKNATFLSTLANQSGVIYKILTWFNNK